MVSKSTRDWDQHPSYAEFAYNRSPNTATKCSPFESVYGVNPLLPLSLVDLPKQVKVHPDAKQQAKDLLRIQRQIRDNIIDCSSLIDH